MPPPLEQESGLGRRSIALGFLAMLPLFAAYEAGVALGGDDGPRNLAELLLCRAFAFTGARETSVRLVILALSSVVAFHAVRRSGLALGRSLLFTGLEGAVFALALGPLIVLGLGLVGVSAADLGLDQAAKGGAPLDRAARAFGAGAWEELLFRVGVLSAAFVVARSVAATLGAGEGLARGLAEAFALAVSALVFAAAHLDVVTRLFGLVGEPWDARAFLWRTLAGVFLAGLFRWRGPGVTAWAHGLFNLALIVGALGSR